MKDPNRICGWTWPGDREYECDHWCCLTVADHGEYHYCCNTPTGRTEL